MSKIYFITGASSGFGRALAEAVLQRGDSAVLTARRTEKLDEIAVDYPQTALAVGLDVTDAAARQAAVKAALDKFGRIDVLANIAGRGGRVFACPTPGANGAQLLRCRRDDA